jgi:hypothetical protein
VLVGACSFLGLAPAQSFDERLAYAYGTHTAVLQATASAKASGALSGDDVQHVVLAADQARALLDAARAVETSDPKGAATKLQTAARILTELQTWLHGRGVT